MTNPQSDHDALVDYVVRDRRLAEMLNTAYELLVGDEPTAREDGLDLLSGVATELRGEA